MEDDVSYYTRKGPPIIYRSPVTVSPIAPVTYFPPERREFTTLASTDPDIDTNLIAVEIIWDWATVLKAMILTLIVLGTIFGNGLVLLAMKFSRDKNLRSSTHYFIANLAAADFCVGVFVHPFLAVLTVSGNWYFGQAYCTIWEYTHFWLCSASILSVMAICIDRYVGVRFPLKHYRLMNKRQVILISCAVWVTALFVSAVPLTVWQQTPSPKTYVCQINQRLGHVLVASFGMLYIPTVVMLALYAMIYYITMEHFKVHRHGLDGAKKTPKGAIVQATVRPKYNRDSITAITSTEGSEEDSNSTGNSTGSTSNGDTASESRSGSTDSTSSGVDLIPKLPNGNRPAGKPKLERKTTFQSYVIDGKRDPEQEKLIQNRNRQVKVAKRLSLVVAAFLLSYVPFFTVFLIGALRPGSISVPVFFFFGWIRYFNSCLNPIIYAATVPAFRKAFKEILSCKRPK